MAMATRTHAIARTAMIILTGAMIASALRLTLTDAAAVPFDLSLSNGIASALALYFS